MKLERSMTARRDFRSYALLLLGLVFAWAGATIDPAKNCDASGHQCAPWLIPLALGVGLLAAVGGAAMLWVNNKWGCRVDLAQRRFFWWDSSLTPEKKSISLDEVGRIKVRLGDNAKIFFYDRDDALMPVPHDEIHPYPYDAWARELIAQFPHIALDVES